MKFEELIKLGDFFEKHLNYKGFNLWELSGAGMYENFFKFPKKKGFFEKEKDYLLKYLVKYQNKKKEGEKTEEIGLKKDFLFVVYGISPLNTFKPIIEKLKGKTKIIRYDPPSEKTTKEFLEKNNLGYSNLDNYITENIKIELKKAEKWLSRQWRKIKKDLKTNHDDKILYDSLEYFCHSRKLYIEIIRMIELYNRIYDIEKPKVVIVSDDANAYGRAAVLVAKKKGIRTICIQHGQLEGNVTTPKGADLMLVNGFRDKEYLVSQGIDETKVKVVGQIRFDDIPKKMKLSREEMCRKFDLDSKKKIIVYSYQTPLPGENVIENAINCFFNNIKKINQGKYQLVLTMRPDTPTNNLQIPKRIKVLKGANIQELAVCSEILITAFSTAAIEYVLMGKPIIAINIGAKKDEYIDYTKLGVGFKIEKEENFFPKLITCLEDRKFKEIFEKNRKNFVKDYHYKMDGKALERILNIIRFN